MEDLIASLNDALVSHNWPMVILVALSLVIPLVLKALGKQIPFLEPALMAIVGALRKVLVKSPPAEVKPLPPSEGLSGVVKVEEVKDETK